MPTEKPGTLAPANPRETQAKLEGLISVLEDDTEEIASESPEPAPAPPPPAPPPQSADTEPPATDEEPDERDAEIVFEDEHGEPVSRGEARKGYLRQADYTRKRQVEAEQAKTAETRIRAELETALASERQQYVDGLATIRQALGDMDAEPERAGLSDAEYVKAHADWIERRAQRERLARHEADERQKVQTAQAKAYQDFIRAEYDKLLVAIPEWSDTDKSKAEIGKLKGFAKKQYGFDDATINNGFSSSAIVLLIRDAMKYHELHREPSPAAKAKVSKIKPASPGTPYRPQPNERQNKLIEKAAKTGRGLDAMKAIESILPDD